MGDVRPGGPVEWLASHEPTGLMGLNQFLAIPSVSTKLEHRPDVARCAEWLADELRRIGLASRFMRRRDIRSSWVSGAGPGAARRLS
jgi:acetylornithine deacetylase/succinyl-diaminopimelate desuccinylase-like protein